MQRDFVKTLESTYFSLRALGVAANNNDTPAILAAVDRIDWTIVWEAFEPVVYGKYKRAIRRHARRAIRNLLRPFLMYHDVERLGTISDMIEWHLAESPSLYSTADQFVAEAWKQEVLKAGLLRKQIRPISPIMTLADLRRAIASKFEEWEGLGRVSGPYQRGESVSC